MTPRQITELEREVAELIGRGWDELLILRDQEAAGMSAKPSIELHALLVVTQAASYDGEARRLVRMGRVAVNGEPAMDEEAVVSGAWVAVLDPDCVCACATEHQGCLVVVAAHLVPPPGNWDWRAHLGPDWFLP